MSQALLVIRGLEDKNLSVRPKPGGGWMAQCPAHDDRVESLSIDEGDDQQALLHCHAGCPITDVVHAIGYELRDLYRRGSAEAPPITPKREKPRDLIVTEAQVSACVSALQDHDTAQEILERSLGWSREAMQELALGYAPARQRIFRGSDRGRVTFAHRDADGKLIGFVGYVPPKQRTEGETKMISVVGSERSLWPQPERVPGDLVYVVEGEPAAVSLCSIGLPAVAVPGSGGWRQGHAARIAEGRSRVVVIPDCDEPGRALAEKIIGDVRATGVSTDVLDLGDFSEGRKGYDVGDLVREAVEAGSTPEQVRALVTAATQLEEAVAVDGAELLDEVVAALEKYVVFPSEHHSAMFALWLATSHAFALDCFDVAPYLAITSAEKQSGKSRLIEVGELLAAKPWKISAAPTISALFRTIEARRPTIFFDEVDELFAANDDGVKQIRAALNAGYRRGNTIPRTEGEHAKREVVDFSVFCMKLLAGLRASTWPDTTRDRCIVIELRRRSKGEGGGMRWRHRHAAPVLNALRDRLAAWAESCVDELRDYEAADVEAISDRKFEILEPLFAVAHAAGGEWPDRAHAAALTLCADEEVETDSLGVRLLRDLRDVFDRCQSNQKLSSAKALEELNGMDDAPWAGFKDGQGLNAFKLGQLLRPYGIKTHSVRIGDTFPKGWDREDFTDAWARYVPTDPPHATDPPQDLPLYSAVVADVADVAGFREALA